MIDQSTLPQFQLNYNMCRRIHDMCHDVVRRTRHSGYHQTTYIPGGRPLHVVLRSCDCLRCALSKQWIGEPRLINRHKWDRPRWEWSRVGGGMKTWNKAGCRQCSFLKTVLCEVSHCLCPTSHAQIFRGVTASVTRGAVDVHDVLWETRSVSGPAFVLVYAKLLFQVR